MTTRALHHHIHADPDLDCLDAWQNDWVTLLNLVGTVAYTLVAVCCCV